MNPKQAQRIAKHFTSFGVVRLDGQTASLYTRDDGTDAEMVAVIDLPCTGMPTNVVLDNCVYMSGGAFMKALRAAGSDGLALGPGLKVCGIDTGNKTADTECAALFRRVTLPDAEPATEFSVPLDRVAAAAAMSADQDIRRYLCGILIDHQHGRIVGCDGHVLGLANGDTMPKSATGRSYLIPDAAVGTILAAKAADWSLIPSGEDAYLLAAGEEVALLVKCSNMKYPDIDRVIPDLKGRRLASVNDPQALARKLLDANRRGKVIDPGQSVMAVLTYRNLNEHDCVLDLSVPILGPASEIAQLPADWTNGKADTGFKIGVNAEYLARALMNAPLGMTLYFGGSRTDAIRAQSAWLDCTVMPMRM